VGNNDTPPTGTAIPRPRLKSVDVPPVEAQPVEIVDFSQLPSSPPPPPSPPRESPVPPSNPTIEDVYRLIDARLSPKIVQRISSYPAPESRPSLPVRAAKATGRWSRLAMAILGVVVVLAEFWADVDKYRGPLTQLFVLAAKKLDANEAPELAPVSEP